MLRRLRRVYIPREFIFVLFMAPTEFVVGRKAAGLFSLYRRRYRWGVYIVKALGH
jgi:hypothetical protein